MDVEKGLIGLRWLGVVGAFILVAFGISYLAGCAGAPSTSQQAAVAADAVEQKQCVDAWATRAEIDACRDLVKSRRDGGK